MKSSFFHSNFWEVEILKNSKICFSIQPILFEDFSRKKKRLMFLQISHFQWKFHFDSLVVNLGDFSHYRFSHLKFSLHFFFRTVSIQSISCFNKSLETLISLNSHSSFINIHNFHSCQRIFHKLNRTFICYCVENFIFFHFCFEFNSLILELLFNFILDEKYNKLHVTFFEFRKMLGIVLEIQFVDFIGFSENFEHDIIFILLRIIKSFFRHLISHLVISWMNSCEI